MPTNPSNPLSAALLWHTTPAGSHYDLLLQTPQIQGFNDSVLTAFRLPLHTSLWLTTPSIPLTPLPDHRKIYLTHQGPVSANRGFVLRADSATFTPHTWTDSQMTLDIHWQSAAHRALCTLTRQSPAQWLLHTVPLDNLHSF